MKKITAIIRPQKLDIVIDRLEGIGISGMHIIDVKGYGTQRGHTETYRGVTYHIRLRKKTRVETVVKDDLVEKVVEVLLESARTGEVGDGKIFVSDIEETIRIRTGEKGEKAL